MNGSITMREHKACTGKSEYKWMASPEFFWILQLFKLCKVISEIHKQASFYCAFCFTILHRYLNFFFLDKWKLGGTPASHKMTGVIFPRAFANFVSLCHILVILTIFQTLSLLLYLLQWSVIFDVTIAIVLEFLSNKVSFN